jgi:hypothetical protein
MTKSVTQTQTNKDALQLNARLFKQQSLFGEKKLVLVIERRFFLCEKNFGFFQRLIAESLLNAETQLMATAKISFNDKTKAILTLKEFGVEIEKK